MHMLVNGASDSIISQRNSADWADHHPHRAALYAHYPTTSTTNAKGNRCVVNAKCERCAVRGASCRATNNTTRTHTATLQAPRVWIPAVSYTTPHHGTDTSAKPTRAASCPLCMCLCACVWMGVGVDGCGCGWMWVWMDVGVHGTVVAVMVTLSGARRSALRSWQALVASAFLSSPSPRPKRTRSPMRRCITTTLRRRL